jgi:kinesin family protein 18/19
MKKRNRTTSAKPDINEIDTDKQKELMSSGKANILVLVRCRPLSKKEIEFSEVETVKIINEKVVFILDPLEATGADDVPLHRSKEQQYAFDYAYDKSIGQQQIYENSCKFLLPGIIEGYNATVFAYGATGAGKTYTMLGTDEEPGIMVRSLSDLFDIISNENGNIKVKLTYIEIYNETLRDLLNNGENLELREDNNKGSHLIGVNEIEVNSSTEVFKVLMKGNKNRTTESTNMNETSSRSHAVLQILVENRKSNTEANVGKFILVDLAGSERATN